MIVDPWFLLDAARLASACMTMLDSGSGLPQPDLSASPCINDWAMPRVDMRREKYLKTSRTRCGYRCRFLVRGCCRNLKLWDALSSWLAAAPSSTSQLHLLANRYMFASSHTIVIICLPSPRFGSPTRIDAIPHRVNAVKHSAHRGTWPLLRAASTQPRNLQSTTPKNCDSSNSPQKARRILWERHRNVWRCRGFSRGDAVFAKKAEGAAESVGAS
jgi:hypothetical protein